jgi:hypothetical protein
MSTPPARSGHRLLQDRRFGMRRTVVGVAVVAALALMPAAAQATPPVREPLGGDDFVLTDHCTFDIGVEFVQNKEISTTFFDKDGDFVRQLVTGVLKVRLTNQEDPEHSVLFNISGPGRYRLLTDGSLQLTGTGTWLHFGITDRPGELLFMHGPFTANINDDGFFLTKLPNNVQDACAMLS